MTSHGADTVRVAAEDLALVKRASHVAQVAEAHLTQIVREVLDREPRAVTAEQVADVLGISRRGLYKRLGTAPPTSGGSAMTTDPPAGSTRGPGGGRPQ